MNETFLKPTLLAALTLAHVATAEQPPPAGYRSLFNGRDLTGWRIPAGDNGHWRVVDGVIDYDAGSEAPGEKHLCYVPNGDHSLRDTNALDTMVAFYHCIVHDVPRPKYEWSFPEPNVIEIECSTEPARVLLWQANNPNARDFRVDTIGRTYRSQVLQKNGDQRIRVELTEPDQGWTASFVQCEFDVGAPTPLRLSTAVRVLPDALPHVDKEIPGLTNSTDDKPAADQR